MHRGGRSLVAPRGGLWSASAACALLAGCSTDFHPKACNTDADCSGGLVCIHETSGSLCGASELAPLRIGMSAAASGPSQDLGTEMKRGVSLAFDAQNEAGGIHGRPVVLEFRDDEYRPDLAEENAKNLLEVTAGAAPPRCPTTTTPPVAGQE